MNEIIPRIDRKGNGRVTIVGRGVSNPKVSARSGGSVIPRFAGRGVIPAGVVLSNSGISSGGLVRVTAYNPEKDRKGIEEAARRKAARCAEEERKEAIKAEAAKRAAVKIVSKVEEKPRYISGHGFRLESHEGDGLATEGEMSQTEKNLADLLEAAEAVKPNVDAQANEEETQPAEAEITVEEFPALKIDEIEKAEGLTAEWPDVYEQSSNIPEEPVVEMAASTEERPRKKKGGRKGKRARSPMQSDE